MKQIQEDTGEDCINPVIVDGMYSFQEEIMSDTIFYNMKLKRTKAPIEVYEKLAKRLHKKNGPTRKWECTFEPDREALVIDFHDEESETFVAVLSKKETYHGFCKVYFDLGDGLFGKSCQFKALLDAFYSVRNMFSVIEFSDDFELASGYWDSKRFKFEYRELTDEEMKRVERLFAEGYTTHESLLRAIMAEDMALPYEEFVNYVNPHVAMDLEEEKITNTILTYIYETAEFQKEGRVYDLPPGELLDLGKFTFSQWSFMEAVAWIFCDGTGYQSEITLEKHRCMMPKLAQMDLVYREKFAPLFIEEKDAFNRCVLAYRFFMSTYEYAGFKYVGRIENVKSMVDAILDEFGEEKGEAYLTCYITSVKYSFRIREEEYRKNFERNIAERYGENFMEEYEKEFKSKYGNNWKYRMEAKHLIKIKSKYFDESLIM